jgi:hypothetical protein
MFSTPTRHIEQEISWYRLPLQEALKLEGTYPTAHARGAIPSYQTAHVVRARNHILQGLLQTNGIFSTPPSFSQINSLAPPWILLPDGVWSSILRWKTPASGTSSFHIEVVALWISRSLIVPELVASPIPDTLIDLEWITPPAHPDLEEVEEIEPVSGEEVVHLRNTSAVRMERNREVQRLWRVARDATEKAEEAEEAFFRTYGESFSEEEDSDDDRS